MALIYLIRHGKTDLVGKRLCGTTPGIPLNEEGRQQAARAARYLSNQPIQAIFSSPIQRAYETAEIISKELILPIISEEFLKEICFGDLQGTPSDKLKEMALWQQYIQHPGEIQFPNGDSILAVQSVVGQGLDKLSLQFQMEDEIACVAHGEVILLAVAYAIHLPLDELHHLSIDTASVTKLEWTPEWKKIKFLNFQPNIDL